MGVGHPILVTHKVLRHFLTLSIGNRSIGMLFLRLGLAVVRWRTRSPLGRRLLGTCRAVFSCIGLETAGCSCTSTLTALANALPALANAPGAVQPWERHWRYGILTPWSQKRFVTHVRMIALAYNCRWVHHLDNVAVEYVTHTSHPLQDSHPPGHAGAVQSDCSKRHRTVCLVSPLGTYRPLLSGRSPRSSPASCSTLSICSLQTLRNVPCALAQRSFVLRTKLRTFRSLERLMTRHVFDLQGAFLCAASAETLGRAAQERGTGDLAPDVSSIDHARAERLHAALLNQQDLLVLSSILHLSASFPLSGCCLRTAAMAILLHCARLIQNPALEVGDGVVGGPWRMLCATADDPCPGSETKCYGTRAVWIIPSCEGLQREPKHS